MNIAEGDCFNQAFLYLLKTLPREEVVYPFVEEATTVPMKEVSLMFASFIEAMKKEQTKMSIPGMDVKGNIFGYY